MRINLLKTAYFPLKVGVLRMPARLVCAGTGEPLAVQPIAVQPNKVHGHATTGGDMLQVAADLATNLAADLIEQSVAGQ